MKKLKCYITQGWPKLKLNISNELKCYCNKKFDIYVNEDIIFYENRIIVPKLLRNKILD